MNILHHCDHPPRPLTLEWRWTGFTPASLLLEEDMKQTLRYLGAVPRRGVTYVRIHFLLELVTVKNPAGEHPLYDWSRLDEGFDALVDNRLIPFVELMGNPSGYFTDFKEPDQKRAWKRFVRDLALHVMERYGKEEVESWWFETWNEPDLFWWKQDDEAFLIYYDGCSEGLKEANPNLRFGGPGTAYTLSDRIKQLLAHVDTGTNRYTGRRDVRMDFLSVHEKGAWCVPEDLPLSPESMVERTRSLLAYMREHHPRLLSIPLMNNECDPQVGWKDTHSWRGQPHYAAIMAKGYLVHLRSLVDGDGSSFMLFGNDNGFLGGWGQRTQLVRFSRKNKEHEQFELIKKPALALMTGMSLLGETRYPSDIEGDPNAHTLCTSLGEEGLAVMTVRVDNRPRIGDGRLRVRQVWRGLSPGTYTRLDYRIDETHGNPYRAWEDGHPYYVIGLHEPDTDHLAAMRSVQELTPCASSRELEVGADGECEDETDLPLPAVHFTLLLRKEAFDPPGPVTDLRAEPYPGINPEENILLTWKPLDSRAVVDHRVEWRENGSDEWREIKHPPLLDGSLVHIRAPLPDGAAYRVRAIDAWGRESPPVCSPEI
jgi:L-iduronidase